MKRLMLFVAAICLAKQLVAQVPDSSHVRIPDITYHALDSIIRTADYTGIFFWSGWCRGCAAEFPKLINEARGKMSIAFYSINDPETHAFALKRRFDFPDVLRGYFRIQRYGRKQAIAINDFSQQCYFLWYYTKRTARDELKQTLSFLLFNKKGDVLYASKSNVNADSIRLALAPYH